MTPSLIQRVREIVPESNSLEDAINILDAKLEDLNRLANPKTSEECLKRGMRVGTILGKIDSLIKIKRVFYGSKYESDDNARDGYDEDRMRDVWMDDQRERRA